MNQGCDKKKYRGLFVVDLDGTLLNSDRQIAREDLHALARLREKEYLVAIATGRSNYSFDQLLAHLGDSGPASSLPVDYVVFSTGAGVMDFPGKRLLKSFSLCPEDVRFTAEYLTRSGLDYMIHRPVPDTRYFLYSVNGGSNPDFHTRLKMYRKFATCLTPGDLDSFGGATQVLCIVPARTGHQVAAEIAGALKQCSVIKATSPLDGQSVWVEIFAPTVSKSKGVKWLADTLGLAQHTICAVGNDYNDQDLLRYAGRSFIVANGPPSLKAHFEGVASNNNGGVGEAAARWLLSLEP
ncbi:HAD family phosphatase [Desulfopila sp. IMCC35006]|uniref:HAD family hydrolase n=1 Tax=Desulfopila sp. IMCC35006 TaxID=2569542 RepID=UPI0010ACE77F|nr:HAD family hydrolase [Desulfopila sp. IMCC35006]TKB25764.1 HAD family phosphatase [Desulfopila sp. IMCC35006]